MVKSVEEALEESPWHDLSAEQKKRLIAIFKNAPWNDPEPSILYKVFTPRPVICCTCGKEKCVHLGNE